MAAIISCLSMDENAPVQRALHHDLWGARPGCVGSTMQGIAHADPPAQIIFVPVPVAAPTSGPVAGSGWIKGPKRPWPAKPPIEHWRPRQEIPSPAAREALEEARRLLTQRQRGEAARV
jgi:hypothetical protein